MKKLLSIILITALLWSTPLPAYCSLFTDTAIEGFEFEKIEAGRKVFSLKAKKATFGNKRIGFFNIALIKVINLEDVDLEVYNVGEGVTTQHFDVAVFELNTGRLYDGDGNLIFQCKGDVSKRDSLP